MWPSAWRDSTCSAWPGGTPLSLTGGEWQLLLCAFLFTLQILLVNHFSPRLDGIQLSFAPVLYRVGGVPPSSCFSLNSPPPNSSPGRRVSVLYCGIMSSGVAYTLQIVGQQELDPTIASLAMCLESVFRALAGWIILGQTLTGTELAGCVLMFRGHRGQPAARPETQLNSGRPIFYFEQEVSP